MFNLKLFLSSSLGLGMWHFHKVYGSFVGLDIVVEVKIVLVARSEQLISKHHHKHLQESYTNTVFRKDLMEIVSSVSLCMDR